LFIGSDNRLKLKRQSFEVKAIVYSEKQLFTEMTSGYNVGTLDYSDLTGKCVQCTKCNDNCIQCSDNCLPWIDNCF